MMFKKMKEKTSNSPSPYSCKKKRKALKHIKIFFFVVGGPSIICGFLLFARS
jgi:hypothetical protein